MKLPPFKEVFADLVKEDDDNSKESVDDDDASAKGDDVGASANAGGGGVAVKFSIFAGNGVEIKHFDEHIGCLYDGTLIVPKGLPQDLKRKLKFYREFYFDLTDKFCIFLHFDDDALEDEIANVLRKVLSLKGKVASDGYVGVFYEVLVLGEVAEA